MKFSLLIFFAMYLSGQALASSVLQKDVTIKVQNASIQSILEEVEKQTGYSFVYNPKELEPLARQTVSMDGSVETLLNKIFKGTEFNYKVVDNTISITKAAVAKTTTQQQPSKKITIKGKVLESDTKNPIAGATLIVTGTQDGAITDEKGMFSLTALPGAEYEVSFVGMKSIKKKVENNAKEIVIHLDRDELAVEDVVVTGIFNRRAGSFTGSANTIKAEDLKRVGNQNVFASLRNLDPSLMIFDNLQMGSDPNQNPSMALRGKGTLDLSTSDLDIKGTYGNDPNAPLFILDGFEASVQKIMDLDMDRVETLTILKDASAKAIYGSKAANGVIVIETKRSKDGKLRVNYKGNLDFQVPDLTSYNLTNAAQKLELERDAGLYEFKPDDRYNAITWIGFQDKYNARLKSVVAGVDTDWLAKPLRTGVGTKHSLGIELGDSRSLRVLADFSYNNVAGVMKGSNRTTFTGSVNVNFIYKNFKFQNLLTVTSNIANDSPYGTFSDYAYMNPYFSPYDVNGLLAKNALASIGEDKAIYGYDAKPEFVANPLYNSQLNSRIEQRYIDVTNNLYVEWTILEGLKATARLGITEIRNSADEFYPSNHLKFVDYSGEDFFRKGSFQQNVGTNKKLSGDVNVNYSKVLHDKHYIFFNAGFKLEESEFEEVIHKTEGFPNDRMDDIIFARQYLKDSKATGREQVIRDFGVPLAFNYAYDDRLLFDASYRVSASSQFGANNRYGQFWSLGAGWNIHNEKWLVDSKAINNFKLRGSMGYTGAQSAEAYAAMATYLYFMDRTYKGALGSYIKGMRNDDLKWQQTLDYNIGLDLNVFRRISVNVDVFKRITENNLLPLDLPGTTGFKTVIENLGEVTNTGIDVRANFIVWQNTKERSYFSINAAASHVKGKVSKVSDALKNYNDQRAKEAANKTVAAPIVKYYDGVSADANWAVPSLGIDPANGREIYLNKKGNPTYAWNANDAVIYGDKLPKINGTIGINGEYKGFGVNLSFLYTYGATIYNETLLNKVENADITKNVDMRLYDGVWRRPGDVKPYKALGDVYDSSTGNYIKEKTQATSRFMQDRNELSLSNVTLSYDFYRCGFVKKASMERMVMSVYMNNLFVLSSLDIERGTSYPFARGVNFSLSITF